MKKLFMCGLIILFLPTLTSCSFSSDTLTLKGDIQNTIIPASTTVSGRIIEMNKQEGESVKKGEVIAVIDNSTQKYNVDQMQAVVDMKKAKLDELKAGARPEQIEEAEAQARAAKAELDLLKSGNRVEQIEQSRNDVEIAQDAVDSAQSSYDYINNQYNNTYQLYQAGAVTKDALDEAKCKLDAAASTLSTAKSKLDNSNEQLKLLEEGSTAEAIDAAQAKYDAANAQVNLLKSGSTAQSIDAAQAELDQATAQLNQAQNNLDYYSIVALKDGVIMSKNYNLGDVVNVGSDIADIAVQDDIYVLCYVPDEYLTKVSYNQSLNVITPIGDQTGTVNYIDLNHEYTPKDKQSTSDSKHIATRIKIAIDDNDGVLKSGMTADIEIPLK